MRQTRADHENQNKQLNETLKYAYLFNNVRIDSSPPPTRRLYEPTNPVATTTFDRRTSFSIEYDNSNLSDNFDINVQFGDLGIGGRLGTERSGNERFGNERFGTDRRRGVSDVSFDLEKFLEDQESELTQMKEMVRLKQAYIRHLQSGTKK